MAGGGGERTVLKRRTVLAMAMDFTLDVPAAVEEGSLDVVMPIIDADLRWAERVFSLYRADSDLSRLSRGELNISDCAPAVAEVLDLCEKYREETGGAFDARRPDGVIDPTGIVKTWAMERARWRLQLLGASAWLWGCAGDMTATGHLGVRATEPVPWRVGIADPRADRAGRVPVIDAIELRGVNAVATSGTAHHGEHIWDPRRGAPAAHYGQVSVAGGDLIECDAWATAIMAGGRKTALAAHARGLHVLTCAVREGKVFSEASEGWRALRV